MNPAPCVRTWQLNRAGGVSANPASLVQRAGSFSAAANGFSQVTLAVTRDEQGLASYVMIPQGAAADQVAMHLAHAVSAQIKEVAAPPSFSTTATVGWLSAKLRQTSSRDTQVGADPTEVARRLVVAMRPGQWLAVTLRKPKGNEIERTRRWYRHKLGQAPVHHTFLGDVMVASIFAGGAETDEVRSMLMQVTASLPGFDVDVQVNTADLVTPVAGWAALTLGATLGGGLGLHDWKLGAAAAAVPALMAAGLASRVLPSMTKTIESELGNGTLPAPRRKRLPTRRPQSNAQGTPGAGTKMFSRSDGDYPLHPSSFLVGPQVVIGVVAPHAGAASGAQATERRAAPAALLRRIGPVIGIAGEADQRVHISARDMFAGVGIAGKAGSGKSLLVRSLFGWNCLERLHPSGLPGYPGRSNTLIAFESKGEGAAKYAEMAQAVGDPTLVVELAEQSSYAIDVFDVPGTTSQRANFFVNAMIYAFGEGAIQDRSYDTLIRVFTGALLVTPEVAQMAKVEQNQSPIVYADMLLGGAGDQRGVDLYAALSSEAGVAKREARDGASELLDAVERLSVLYGKVTESQRRTLCEAPRNKVSQLLEAETWWSPTRPKISWTQVLASHASIVVNTGVSSQGVLVPDRLTAQMSALLTYSLREAIMRVCNGWDAAGRSVSIFADEVSLLAGSSPEVLTWLRNQGRSYGVHPVFATQYTEQLDGPVRLAMLGFDTFFWFTQTSPQVADEAARDLAADGSEWTSADVVTLERYHAIVRANVDQQRQPAVPVRMINWEENLAAFAERQGYASAPAASADW